MDSKTGAAPSPSRAAAPSPPAIETLDRRVRAGEWAAMPSTPERLHHGLQ